MPYGYIEIDDGHAIVIFRDSDIPEGPPGPAGGAVPHHATHENTGTDEISVAGLSGALADDQPPAAHAINGAKHTGLLNDGQVPAGIMRDAEHGSDAHTFLWRRHQYQLFIPGTLTTGAKKLNVNIPVLEGFTLEEIYIYADTAPTGATVIVDIHYNGTTVFTNQANRPAIAIGAHAATSGAPDVTAMAKNGLFTIEIDQIGSTIAGADMMVSIRGKLNLATS